MAKKEQKKTCDICGGSGQLSFFKGVSRFLLSTEECSECAGTGYQLQGGSRSGELPGPEKENNGRPGKKRK
jgi:DnaJ-class molecular chaperone